MGRDEGFVTADTDTGLYDDGKVKKLWKQLRDENAMARCMVIYEATRLASWAAGERLGAEDAAPIWLSSITDEIKALQEVGLLDEKGCIPTRAWAVWYGRAATARQKMRDRWNRAGKKSPQVDNSVDTALNPQDISDVTAQTPRGTSAGPRAPDRTGPVIERSRANTAGAGTTKPSGPKKNEARLTKEQLDSWANFGPEWGAFKEAWLGRGLLYAPFGSPDDGDDTQRGLLWQVLDARPTDVVRWVREAPKATSRDVIAYILERWHDIREEVGVDEAEAEAEALERRRDKRGALAALGDILGGLKPEPA